MGAGWAAYDAAMDWLNQTLDTTNLLGRAIVSLLVIVGLYALRRAAARWYVRTVDDPDKQYRARKLIGYVFSVLTVLALGVIWFPFFGDLATFLGILSAGLAVALRDLFTNLAAWVYIVSQQPFVVGDRVEIAGNAGDVVDIRGLRFTLREIGNWVDADQPTGRLVHIPNGFVFSNPMANYTRDVPYVWHEIEVLITFESDWRAAEQHLLHALAGQAVPDEAVSSATARASARLDYPIDYGDSTTSTYVATRESGVAITGRVLVDARRRRRAHDGIWRSVLDAFSADATVELAYPTVRNVIHDPITVEHPGE